MVAWLQHHHVHGSKFKIFDEGVNAMREYYSELTYDKQRRVGGHESSEPRPTEESDRGAGSSSGADRSERPSEYGGKGAHGGRAKGRGPGGEAIGAAPVSGSAPSVTTLGTVANPAPGGIPVPGKGPVAGRAAGIEQSADVQLEGLGPYQVVIELAPGETFTDMPSHRLLCNPEIMPMILIMLGRARRYIYGTQYCMDHAEAFSLLENAVRREVYVCILMDADQFTKASCSQQSDRIRTLAEIANGYGKERYFQLRTLKPTKYGAGVYNSQHSKTWLVDGEIYLDGSANLTGQSCKNEESAIMERSRRIVLAAEDRFSELWKEGIVMTYDLLLALPRREDKRSASGSASREEPRRSTRP